MFRYLRHSRLAQAGTVLVILGALMEFMDSVGALDLSGLPVVGKYAPAILAVAGVLKIVLRLAIVLITGLSAASKGDDKPCSS